ncbi:MAG: hypothetical protein P8X77_18375 [Maritimibacter sp.]
MSKHTQDIIDTWDIATFPTAVIRLLEEQHDVLTQYYVRECELDEGSNPDDIDQILRSNRFEDSFLALTTERIPNLLSTEHLRGWHYTRLLDIEVEKLQRDGIQVSTWERMCTRLSLLQKEGFLSSSEVSKLIANSPLNDPTQHKSRKDLFWMTSKPTPVSNPGITPLVSHWGGEVIYFWQDDSLLMSKLKSLGKTRIVEVRAPLSSSNIRHRAADSMDMDLLYENPEGEDAYRDEYQALFLPVEEYLRNKSKEFQ